LLVGLRLCEPVRQSARLTDPLSRRLLAASCLLHLLSLHKAEQ
jgi:hypothetical protein